MCVFLSVFVCLFGWLVGWLYLCVCNISGMFVWEREKEGEKEREKKNYKLIFTNGGFKQVQSQESKRRLLTCPEPRV